MLKVLENYKLVFYLLLAVDVLILVLHLRFANSSVWFHLDYEYNLPTYYQSAKLILFGLFFLALNLVINIPQKMKYFVIPLGIVMIFLGFDELLQIHENSYRLFRQVPWLDPDQLIASSASLGYRSSLWLLYYIPLIGLFVAWCLYWMRYFKEKHRHHFWIVLAAAVLLGLILVAEVLGSTGDYTYQEYFWLVTIEETSEMLLATVLVLGGLKVYSHYR